MSQAWCMEMEGKVGVATAAQATPQLVSFPLLADPSNYVASTFNYVTPAEGQPSAHDWCNVFRKSVPEFRARAAQDPAVPAAEREVSTT